MATIDAGEEATRRAMEVLLGSTVLCCPHAPDCAVVLVCVPHAAAGPMCGPCASEHGRSHREACLGCGRVDVELTAVDWRLTFPLRCQTIDGTEHELGHVQMVSGICPDCQAHRRS